MAVASRRTVVVHSRFSMREHRLAARDRCHGLQIMSFEHMAVRLAGGFIRPVDNEKSARRNPNRTPHNSFGRT